MEVHKGNIFGILNGDKQFLIPVYQRYYSWELEQCKRLWNDIVVMQKEKKVGHFVGSIVNIAEQAMPTGIQKYMIIDGQQRLTTLTLLLIALRNYALNNPDDKTINAHRIDGMLLKNEFESGEDRYKLLLTDNDKDILISLVERKPIKEGVKSRLLDNYKFFSSKIDNHELTPAETYEAIGKLLIVNITLDRQTDDAQAIFESLNSTGKELSESDLIRNYILMGLEPAEQTYIYEHLWRPMEQLFVYETQEKVMDAFFRHYLTMKMTSIPKQGRVYETFKLFHMNSEFNTIRELCEDLIEYARYYTNIVYKRSDDKELKQLYDDIIDLRMEVSYPFLLKVHHDCNEGLITTDDLKEVLRYCISYVFRRNICGMATNSLNKTFAIFKNSIHNDDYMNSVKASFMLLQTYKEFPNDEQFSSSFVIHDMYNMRTRNYVLSRLENYDNKAPINIGNYTIEHIMPQNKNLSEEWQKDLGDNWKEIQKMYIHTIGNLTLTAYNSEMSDHSFKEKMNMEGGFKESALRLNKYVVSVSEWNAEHIKGRAKQLCDKALKIWPYPDLTDEVLESYKPDENTPQEYSLETYDMNSLSKTLFEALDKRILNLSPQVKREYKKRYVAYKLDTNFVDIIFQKKGLRISVNMKFSEVYDPKGICKDITNLGRWGNGDVEVSMRDVSEIDQVMEIIEQSFNIQNDE